MNTVLKYISPKNVADGMSERERWIRKGFCFDSDRDCEAARYLIGVIDVIRALGLDLLCGLITNLGHRPDACTTQRPHEARCGDCRLIARAKAALTTE